jgi:hypothetical protein
MTTGPSRSRWPRFPFSSHPRPGNSQFSGDANAGLRTGATGETETREREVALTDTERAQLTQLSTSKDLSTAERRHLTALLNEASGEPRSLMEIAREKWPQHFTAKEDK